MNENSGKNTMLYKRFTHIKYDIKRAYINIKVVSCLKKLFYLKEIVYKNVLKKVQVFTFFH